MLHVLRDRLTPEQAVHLGRNSRFSCEGSSTTAGALRESGPTNANRWNSQPSLRPTCPYRWPGALRVTSTVFGLLEKELDRGESDRIIATLPHPLRVLWPGPISQETPPL